MGKRFQRFVSIHQTPVRYGNRLFAYEAGARQ
jgi:hypothetical protein